MLALAPSTWPRRWAKRGCSEQRMARAVKVSSGRAGSRIASNGSSWSGGRAPRISEMGGGIHQRRYGSVQAGGRLDRRFWCRSGRVPAMAQRVSSQRAAVTCGTRDSESKAASSGSSKYCQMRARPSESWWAVKAATFSCGALTMETRPQSAVRVCSADRPSARRRRAEQGDAVPSAPHRGCPRQGCR